MFVLIVGSGRLGAGLASVLSSQGNDVVVLSEKIDMKWLGSDFDGVTVEGNPIDEDILEKAGIRKAEVFVAATSDDTVNAMAAQIAREIFHVPIALARMTDPARQRFYEDIGLQTVCPTSTGINQILDIVQRASFTALAGHIDPGVVGVVPPREWLGQKIDKLPIPAGRRLAGLERNGRIVPPEAGLQLGAGDVLIIRRLDQARGKR